MGGNSNYFNMIIKFKRGYKSYVVGDIAGFSCKESEAFVKKGYADYLGEVEREGVEETQSIPNGSFDFKKKVPRIEGIICAICGKTFLTKKELTDHLWKKHKIK